MKKTLLLFFLITFNLLSAQETAYNKISYYGFVRSDFYFNSRQNVEVIDGIFDIFPKPVILDSSGKDINNVPQAEMLSVATRFGININGPELFKAKSTAKIETDFCGTGTTSFILRLRQAYMKLNWKKTELLVGQTWHPLYGNVSPTLVSFNSGSPFQPFNRSPQLRLKQNISPTLSITGAAIYQMQYASFGPEGRSNIYMKKALLPNFYLGIENTGKHVISGIGIDIKTIKPDSRLFSRSTVAYVQYTANNLQVKAKTLIGQNLSDMQMPLGYGINGYDAVKKEKTYTSFNQSSTWLNIVYGKIWQVGVFGGYLKNLGTDKNLLQNSNGDYIVYDSGYFSGNQHLDELFRVSPHISYNYQNIRIGIEYDLTNATYGKLKNNGRVESPYSVNNHRISAAILYNF